VSERRMLVNSPKKIQFDFSISFRGEVAVADSQLKEKFETVLNNNAPSWQITCTSFSWEPSFNANEYFFCKLKAELIVQPRVKNFNPLIFAPSKTDAPLFLPPEIEVIKFSDVFEALFMKPVSTVTWKYDVTDFMSPEPEAPTDPSKPSKEGQKFPWWIVIVVGVIALLIFTMSRR